jgi:hypothetical protein
MAVDMVLVGPNNSFSGRRAAPSRASRCKATSPGSGK